MTAHKVFAQISDGTVQNIIIGENYPTADHLTKCIYGENAFAIECTQCNCSINDKYHDSRFWTILEDGTEQMIEYIPTQEQQLETLTYTVSTIQNELGPTIDTETCTLEELKEYTILQFGKKCSTLIYDGSDVNTSKGTKHFSYEDTDQTNLGAAVNLAIMTGLEVPYHADGEDCCLWTVTDITKIYGANELLKTYQTTYCNLLNGIVRNSNDKETILSITYGDNLPAEKHFELDAAVQQAQTIYDTLLNSLPVK